MLLVSYFMRSVALDSSGVLISYSIVSLSIVSLSLAYNHHTDIYPLINISIVASAKRAAQEKYNMRLNNQMPLFSAKAVKVYFKNDDAKAKEKRRNEVESEVKPTEAILKKTKATTTSSSNNSKKSVKRGSKETPSSQKVKIVLTKSAPEPPRPPPKPPKILEIGSSSAKNPVAGLTVLGQMNSLRSVFYSHQERYAAVREFFPQSQSQSEKDGPEGTNVAGNRFNSNDKTVRESRELCESCESCELCELYIYICVGRIGHVVCLESLESLELWLFLCSAGILCHVEWCIRKPSPSSIISCNKTGMPHKHHTHIHPLLYININIDMPCHIIITSLQAHPDEASKHVDLLLDILARYSENAPKSARFAFKKGLVSIFDPRYVIPGYQDTRISGSEVRLLVYV